MYPGHGHQVAVPIYPARTRGKRIANLSLIILFVQLKIDIQNASEKLKGDQNGIR
jgi:hypothetical protein